MNIRTPHPVQSYLRRISHPSSAYAYFKIDAENCVLESGGNLEYFDVQDFNATTPLDEQLPPLSGLLPASDAPVVIANTKIDSVHFFDLHIYMDIDGQWVLLLDTTETSTKLQHEQQIRLSNDYINEKQ